MVQITENYEQTDFHYSRPSRRTWLFLGAMIIILSMIGFVVGSSSNELEISGEPAPFWQKVVSVFSTSDDDNDPNYIMPEKEKERLDILIMGIRGEDDPEHSGDFLTDTMMLFSFNKETKNASLVSIPRDLYVRINKNRTGKINEAYPNLGLKGTKELVSKITGVYIDKAVILDFTAFEKLIDAVGGVDIVLAKPFEEPEQWGYGFSLPAGPNHLNGQDALYYIRSRYSTSDFDRSRRQQDVLFALKDKLMEHNWWTDPIKTLEIAMTVNANIRTDFNILDTRELINLGNDINSADQIKRYVITTENLVYDTHTNNGTYILLPVGENFDQIKQLFQDILK